MTALPWLWVDDLAWPLALWIGSMLAPHSALRSWLSPARELTADDSR